MRGNLFIDARNQYSPELVAEAGLSYVGIGRQVKPEILKEVNYV